LVLHPVQVTDSSLRPTNLVIPAIRKSRRVHHDRQELWFSVGGLAMAFRASAVRPFIRTDRSLSKWGRGPAPFDEWVSLLASLSGVTVMLTEPLVLYRRHESAVTGDPRVTFSPSYQRRLGWKAGSAEYSHMADVADSRSQLAKFISGQMIGDAKQLTARMEHFYGRVARTYRRRAALYGSSSRLARLATCTRMFVTAGYMPRTMGGLGLKSLAKDLCSTLFVNRH
jgi:hypothetical protein